MVVLGGLLGALGGLVSPQGKRLERHFTLEADNDGRVRLETEVEPPVAGTLLGYSVQLQGGTEGRRHSTRITIKNLSKPGENRTVGPVSLVDFEEYEATLSFRVARGNRYAVCLESDGFESGETVSGLAAARFKLG